MKLQIDTTAVHLTPDVEQYINKKVGILARFVKGVSPEPTLRLHFKTFSNKKSGNTLELHANIVVNGETVAVKDQAEDAKKLFDLVVTKLKRALRNVKSKKIDVKRRRDLKHKLSQRFSRLVSRR